MDKFVVVVRHINTYHCNDRINRQKIINDLEDLFNTINLPNPLEIYKIFHLTIA